MVEKHEVAHPTHQPLSGWACLGIGFGFVVFVFGGLAFAVLMSGQ